MAMIVYSGDIPLLFWHLNLSADSVGQPERGTLEAQGDEKIDQGDEEARKGEDTFKKTFLTFLDCRSALRCWPGSSCCGCRGRWWRQERRRCLRWGGRQFRIQERIWRKKIWQWRHMLVIFNQYSYSNQDVFQIGIQHFQNIIYQQKQRALSLTTGLDYRLHQDFFNFHPQNQSQKTQAFKNTKESIKKWTKDFGECCRDLDKTS